jgi:hypothetical protein
MTCADTNSSTGHCPAKCAALTSALRGTHPNGMPAGGADRVAASPVTASVLVAALIGLAAVGAVWIRRVRTHAPTAVESESEPEPDVIDTQHMWDASDVELLGASKVATAQGKTTVV